MDGVFVIGFSGMYDSGIGGSLSLGNFLLFFFINCLEGDINWCVFFKKSWVVYGGFGNNIVIVKFGIFGIILNNGIRVDMIIIYYMLFFRFIFLMFGLDG